MIHKDIC